MAYYHSKSIDLIGVMRYLRSLDKSQMIEILKSKQKLKETIFGKNIEYLEPHVSSHGESWVYAAKDKIVSLLFGSSKSHGDFDGIINVNKDGKICFKEAYEGAFKNRFDKAVCVLFEVDPTGFEEGKTSFEGEVVSSKPAKVLSRKKVSNIYNELNEAIEKGEFELVTYQKDNPEYVQEIEEHIESRIKNSGILDQPNSYLYKFCKKKFPNILKKVQNQNESQLSESQPGNE